MQSPVSWLTDDEYALAPPPTRALAWADSYVGQKEIGHNRGPFVTMILKGVGLGPGYPWCASLVSWCIRQAGSNAGPKKGRAAVRNWLAWARQEGRIVEKGHARRGDLWLWVN